jgi:hypothetical protein
LKIAYTNDDERKGRVRSVFSGAAHSLKLCLALLFVFALCGCAVRRPVRADDKTIAIPIRCVDKVLGGVYDLTRCDLVDPVKGTAICSHILIHFTWTQVVPTNSLRSVQ